MDMGLADIKKKIPFINLSWPDACRQMGMTPQRYLIQVALPLALIAILMPWFIIKYFYLLPDISNLPRTAIIVSIFLASLIPLFPFIWREMDLRKSEANLPMFITQMAIISTSGASAIKIIKRVSTMEEYGSLIKTMKWVDTLIERFHMPAAQALHKAAQDAATGKVREFLERFSNAVEVGEAPARFLTNEQDVAMDDYSTAYATSLSEVEGIKDSMASMVTAALFMTTFLMMVPIITGVDVSRLLIVVVLVFLVIEGFNFFIVISKLPADQLWYKKGDKETQRFPFPVTNYLRMVIVIGLFLVVMLTNYLMPMNIPISIKLPLAITPMLLPGIIISIEEKRIKDREVNFAPFMRALGRAGELRGETFIGNLRRLSIHEFGCLNEAIQRLTRRLSTRIKSVFAWRHFSSETGSNLINKYSEMYVQGIEEGGDPREISIIIDINLVTAMELRQERIRLAGALSGLFYGLMVSIAFTLYVSLNLLVLMSKQVSSIDVDPASGLSYGFVENLANIEPLTSVLTMMITAILMIHAFASSSIIARLKGGHPATGYVHFVGLVWCGTITAYITNTAVTSLF